jgi:competence protein CoiA
MRFALIDNKQDEAKAGLRGVCPGCSQPVVAKCGNHRVHHWAHVGNKMCDRWWEQETEWHRQWKNNFPAEWQEVFLPDKQTGEKHVADVRTSHGLIIEFQHSHIHPEERSSREKFYGNMVWVVDGSRLKRDYPRFLKGKKNFRYREEGLFEISYPEEYFPTAWLDSSVPVLFDFTWSETSYHIHHKHDVLFCLFTIRLGTDVVVVAEVPKGAFIRTVISGDWLERMQRFTETLLQEQKEIQQRRREIEEIEKQRREQQAAAYGVRLINDFNRRRRGWRF